MPYIVIPMYTCICLLILPIICGSLETLTASQSFPNTHGCQLLVLLRGSQCTGDHRNLTVQSNESTLRLIPYEDNFFSQNPQLMMAIVCITLGTNEISQNYRVSH